MQLLSRLSQDTNSKSLLHYLIVDSQEKTFCLVTREQFETMREEYIFIPVSTLKTRQHFWGILGSSFQPQDAGSYFSITSHGLLLALMMTTNGRNWIGFLKDLNFSQKSLSSLL